ncbi:hypothetical protein CISIN_1g016243mg [Citrus sinensis]|uniref:Uncharacterized protein n=1 Tax=Citrus sinensis TaxID=2711 RepID=A0A067F2N3_CITSI|nr:hypothetical protein CISIN_1g016243mg [Citrus sinensis]
MLMLVDCSKCRTTLQLPPGAQSIRCAICQAITHIADPRSGPPPPSSSSSSSYQPGHVPPSAVAPSPYNHAPPGQPPHAQGRKRALIVGVSYRHTNHELKGCINDARCMKYMLTNRFKFPESSIVMLTEEDPDPLKRPTKYNMRMALYWLIQGCQPGDSLLFHFSGHGSQQRNYNGEEVDGYDETLCPVDFETQGMIVDDEINTTLVRPLPRGARLHAIIDACHSGTVLDLPFLCRMDRQGKYIWEDHRPRSGMWKGTSGGEAISFSGCDDNQTSADTSALSKITSTGAMTYSFIQAIERGHGATYGSMLNSMRSTIRNTDSGSELSGAGGLVTSLVTMLLTGGSLSGGFRQVFMFVMFANCYGYGLSSSLFDRFVSRLLLGFLIDGLAHTCL